MIRDVLWLTVVVGMQIPLVAGYEVRGEIAKGDLKHIEAVVVKLTTLPIIKVRLTKLGEVEVVVGVMKEPLGTSVTIYTLEKRNGVWVKTGERGYDT